ncbi:MAG TPA: sigma-70 family RNA polymerase sigma factor [Pyrinomonadaceae bacterium]|nr:sigma-70 family RNA polymerase sigma factor [Pyrinomonadaceae bacterium]
MSYGEPIALGGHLDIEQVAAATPGEVRHSGEEWFVERLKAGEPEAFDRLVSERSGEVYGLLYRLTEDAEEARDLTQETFLRAFQSIKSFRGDADLKTWIYRIAINQARNRWRWWRRRRRDVTISLDMPNGHTEQPLSDTLRATAASDPEQETLARERERAISTALHSIGRSYREVVILRDVEGFAYEEMAKLLEISIGTVKSRLSRGRMELRRKLSSSL